MKDRFTGPMYYRLWWPAMLSSVGWALRDMADAVVVGQRLGATGLAAISLILPVYMINCMMAHGLGLGGSIQFSTLLSKGQEKRARAVFMSILFGAFLFSISTAVLGNLFIRPLLGMLGTVKEDGELFTSTKDYLQILLWATPLFYLSNILNYFLRNDSKQKIAGIGSVVGNVSDITLNIFLVLVMNMGTRGAALSTAIGQIITIIIYVGGLWRQEHHLQPALPEKGSLKTVYSCMREGLATSVQYLYQMIFFLICNNVLIRLSGETGVAVFDLVQNTSYLILYLYEGTARAMQPILSTYHGEHNYQGRKNAVRLGFLSGILTGSLFIGLVAFFPRSFCLLFGIQEAALQTVAVSALRIYCLGAFFAGISILVCNYYQSCEKLKAPFLIETMRGFAVLIPCTLLFSNFGLENFWWLFPITEIGTVVLFLLWKRIRNYRVEEEGVERVYQYTIEGGITDLTELCEGLERFCEQWEASVTQQYFVVMAAEELGLAILTHGLYEEAEGYIQVTVVATEEGKFKLHLRDNALKFNPFSMETQRLDAEEGVNLDAMGILVLKEKAEEFYYQRYQGFNSLVVTI